MIHTNYTCQPDQTIDNSKQECDKYLPFAYTPEAALDLGIYKITLTSKDKADNTAPNTTFTLNVTTLAQVITPQEREIIEEEIKELPQEEQEIVKEELEITKPVEPSTLEKAGEQISQTSANILNATGNLISTTFNVLEQGVGFLADTTGKALVFVWDSTGQALAFVLDTTGQSLAFIGRTTGNAIATLFNGTQSLLAYLGQGIENTGIAIGDGYNQLASNTTGVVRTVLTGIGSGVSATTNAIANVSNTVVTTTVALVQNTASTVGDITSTIATTTSTVAINTRSVIVTATQNTLNSARDGISGVAFSVGEKTQDVSDVAGFAIVKFGYLFINEPTTIANVKVDILSPTSAKISWETNHPANGKVNYGLDRTYSFDVQSEKRITQHEFTLTNLEPDTLYHFEVMSHNKNYVYDANREFKTPPAK